MKEVHIDEIISTLEKLFIDTNYTKGGPSPCPQIIVGQSFSQGLQFLRR
jgi:hypothetical protein